MLKKLPVLIGLMFSSQVLANGVSAYLPLKQNPQLEHLVEKLLVVGDNAHMMSKPYKTSEVLRVLKSIEHSYPSLYQKLFNELALYKQSDAVTYAKATLAYGNESKSIPNQRGQKVDTYLKLEAGGFANFGNHFGVSVAGIANEDNLLPTQSFVYFGNEYAQVDIGYREHWYSPFNDSAMILSTNAKILPSISISNVKPITDFDIRYDLFYMKMKTDPAINSGKDLGKKVPGKPNLAAAHLSFSPFSGLTLGVNRLLQFGGGDRSVSLKGFTEAFFLPGGNDNVNAEEIQKYGPNYEVGDQLASLSFDYKAAWFDMPFSFYGDIGAEDTQGGRRNNAYNFGLYLPYLSENHSLRLENNRWQEGWYYNHLYSLGNSIDGQVLGHWAGNERGLNHQPAAESQSINWVWKYSATRSIDTTIRRIENGLDQIRNNAGILPETPYTIGFELETRYTQQLQDGYWGLELYTGKTVFDDNFFRLSAFYGW
ncbi:capsule assembly Wzi family protein [Pseudoalteromonas fuliginea]|uniref:Capsule assembly Wzi family protein n=1 Tax=Pseudoalteromonas fuliginea TaxID=1872678 RepID=A0ABD3Y610_9GAMM|nr:capsule assembly Wzi family protein [Pseudoalteromonas fuliginea]KDC49487.1 hypothetical protein DC53_16745 [Pseudoalteromonas fuliginea]KJZ27701.1 hypothetical protein TW82_10645 [Pseudoalteromonas fuliginea]